ncbi:MAG: AraC family transcriptional regulator [Acidimicrobiia bacterium]
MDASPPSSRLSSPLSSALSPLQSALEQLRLVGAIFFRSELTDGFAFESTPLALADALHPGAQRLILFHIVAHGSCWVAAADGERHWACQGDVIVLPYGDQHTIGGAAPAETVSIMTLLDAPPWQDLPLIRHGGGGERTDLVCGYLYSDDPLFDPAMRVFPPAFVVRLTGGAAAGWVQASIAYAIEEAVPSNASTSLISTRLPELVVIEVLRVHLASAPAADRGWLAALRDPVLAPALSLLHSDPGRRWTVADLASGAAVSRSLLAERFSQILGRSPIRYLTEWRMHLAEDLLATTDTGVATVARRVGYDSEEAFSRAFKRARGLSPTHWRAARAAPLRTPAS